MSNYPSLEELLESEDKTKLLQVKRSFRSVLSHMFWFAFSLLAVIVINVEFYTLREKWGFAFFDHFSPRWLALIPLILFLEILRKHHDDLYIFGIRRVTHHEGRLSLNYNVPSVKYIDIRGLVVRQDIIGRILNYGDIEIGTAAQTVAEVIIRGVLAPKKLAKLLEDLRVYNMEQGLEDVDAELTGDDAERHKEHMNNMLEAGE